jgi:hypothetical protein
VGVGLPLVKKTGTSVTVSSNVSALLLPVPISVKRNVVLVLFAVKVNL